GRTTGLPGPLRLSSEATLRLVTRATRSFDYRTPARASIGQLESRQDFLFRLLLQVARELVARRLVVDVDLADHAKRGSIVECAYGHGVTAGRLQVVEKAGAALAAEAT